MDTYAKKVNGVWHQSGKQFDDSWLPIVKDGNGSVTGPPGLSEQINADKLSHSISTWKESRAGIVSSIEVDHNGVIYQGDEESQNRILRAINRIDDSEKILWTAKDNTVHQLTKNDFKAILSKSGLKQDEIWSDVRPT